MKFLVFIATLMFEALGLGTLNAQLSPDPLQVSSLIRVKDSLGKFHVENGGKLLLLKEIVDMILGC